MSDAPVHQRYGPLARFYVVLILGAVALWIAGAISTRHGVKVAGGCREESSTSLEHGRGRVARTITYCQQGDADQTTIQSDEFPRGTARVDIETAGYVNNTSVQLVLQASNGDRIIEPINSAGERWRPVTILVPRAFRHGPFRILLIDNSTISQGWAGLAVVRYSWLRLDGKALAGALLGLALLHFLMLELSALAARLYQPGVAALISVTSLGLLSYAAFWAYYASHALGSALSLIVLLSLVAHAGWRQMRQTPAMCNAVVELHHWLAPVTVSALLLSIVALYPFPASWDTWQYAASRWINLPIDNWLPKIFADQVWRNAVANPMIGDWLSSDRPPLQAGFALLLQLPAHRDGWYQLASTWLQMTFLIPVAYLLPALGLDKVRSAVVCLLSTSALVLYNGTFVWPKLIAATYCLIFYIAAASTSRKNLSPPLQSILMGCCAALAMLAHGGTLFAIAGIACMALAIKAERKWPALLGAGVVAVVVYMPWSLYQHFIDPPGTRLLAWHLAGVQAVTSDPVTTVIRHAYDQLTWQQWLEGRWENVRRLFTDALSFFVSLWHALVGGAKSDAGATLRAASFRYFFYSMWFFSPLLWLLVFKRVATSNGSNRNEVLRQIGAIVIGLAFWSLLIFTPGETINHQGSYSLNIMAMLVSMAAVYGFSRPVFHVLAALNLLVFARLFLVAPHAIPQDFQTVLQPALGVDWVYLLICIGCFCGLYCAGRALPETARFGPGGSPQEPLMPSPGTTQ